MKCFGTTLLIFASLVPVEFSAADETEPLFSFTQADDAKAWQIVNDGVMGGRSTSRFKMTQDGHLRFAGDLSLENNGGFASVRLRPQPLDFSQGQTIKLRAKGDGRKYTFNLYVPDRRTAFSFQHDFQTEADQWVEVQLPLKEFVAHWYGRPVPSERLDPSQVNSVGVLLGDKKAGPFELEIDWIDVE